MSKLASFSKDLFLGNNHTNQVPYGSWAMVIVLVYSVGRAVWKMSGSNRARGGQRDSRRRGEGKGKGVKQPGQSSTAVAVQGDEELLRLFRKKEKGVKTNTVITVPTRRKIINSSPTRNSNSNSNNNNNNNNNSESKVEVVEVEVEAKAKAKASLATATAKAPSPPVPTIPPHQDSQSPAQLRALAERELQEYELACIISKGQMPGNEHEPVQRMTSLTTKTKTTTTTTTTRTTTADVPALVENSEEEWTEVKNKKEEKKEEKGRKIPPVNPEATPESILEKKEAVAGERERERTAVKKARSYDNEAGERTTVVEFGDGMKVAMKEENDWAEVVPKKQNRRKVINS